MYIKIIQDNYIAAVGTGDSGVEITEEEYNHILQLIHNRPARVGDTDYRLTTGLEWEAYSIEPTPEEEPSAEEILNILTGGAE